MSHGGKRTGAGRPPGAKSRKTVERLRRLEQIKAAGNGPLDVMLGNMRHACEMVSAAERRLDTLDPTDEQAAAVLSEAMRWRCLSQDFARDAAPYMHPKLRQIEHGGPDGGPRVGCIEVRFIRPPLREPESLPFLPSRLPTAVEEPLQQLPHAEPPQQQQPEVRPAPAPKAPPIHEQPYVECRNCAYLHAPAPRCPCCGAVRG